MANIKSAKKRILVSQTRYERNKSVKSAIKTATKKVEAAVANKDKETVSLEDFKALQEQMKQMMALLNSKQNEIEELKNNKQATSDDDIQENDYVTIRNVSTGSVVVGTRNNEYILENEGDIERVQFNELRSLKNAHPKFFTIPLIVIDDEKAVKKLGLEKLYSELAYLNDLKTFFENNYEDEIVQKLNKLSDFSRMQVFEKLKQMVKDKTFIDMDVRELIKKHYTIDIFEK